MKKTVILSLILLLAGSAGLSAQTPAPAPDPDTIPNPVQEGDPAVRQLLPGMDYLENRQRITPEEVPDPVKQTPESSAQYTDGQKAVIFHDKNNGLSLQ